tara:strand:- start:324 stop:641 length:318 start_codon:yes stop_codon:yes gene_type:complete
MIEISIILTLSIMLNVFLIWYVRSTLINLLYISDNLGALYEIILGFTNHLETVYELERFYGDPTLTNLLEHSKALSQELEAFEEIFLLSEGPEEDEVEDEEETQP